MAGEKPKKSSRFLDTARQLRDAPARINQDARDGLRDALPQASEAVSNARNREHGIKGEDISNALNTPGLAGKAKELGKTALAVPGKSIKATGNNISTVNKLAKNKKWFIAGGTGLGLLIPIVAFFFWLMLFKNVHIKNMYVTYRWAQFNRGLNKTLKGQLEYAKNNPDAKPAGTADTVVNADDPIDKITADTNADEFSSDKIDPDDPAAVEAESRKLTSLEQSVEGSSEKPLQDAGSSRSVKSAEGTGDTPDERAKSAEDKAKANVEDELSGKKIDKNPSAALKDGVEETEKQQEAGKPAAEAVEDGVNKVLDADGWQGKFARVSTAVFAATMYCIFRDIYTSARDQLVQLAVSGAMGVSQQVNKTADCGISGNCDLNQMGAVSQRYDNDEESFMTSCGAKRAAQEDMTGCKEIDPKFVVGGLADEVGGAAGVAMNSAEALLDPPMPGIEGTCNLVENTAFQLFMTGAEFFAIGSTGGWAAIAKGAGTGVATFAGTAGGKALIASYIAKFSGSVYKDLGPVALGNLTDMGNMATASGTCAVAGCPTVSDEQLAQLDREYRSERIAANSKRSVFEKFFDTSTPDSVIVRATLNAPITPSAMIGRVKTVFASLSSPLKLNLSIGNNALAVAGVQSAYADAGDGGAAAYGLSGNVFAPPSLLEGSSDYATVAAWSKTADLASLKDKFGKCGTDSYAARISAEDKTCSWNDATDGVSLNEKRLYFQAAWQKNAGYKNAIMRNKQSTVQAATGGGGTEVDTSGVKRGESTAGRPCPAGTTTYGTATTFGGANIQLCDIGDATIVNQSAASAFYNMKQAAAADGIKLYGGGFRSYEQQVALRKQNCADWQNSSPGSCSPPTAKPGRSNHEEGLAVDFRNSSSRGTAVYNWLSANASRFGIRNLPSEAWHWSVNGK